MLAFILLASGLTLIIPSAIWLYRHPELRNSAEEK